jgi:hypothetical protein
MADILGNLQPYFASLSKDDVEKIDELHTVFQDHFMDHQFYFEGKHVIVKRHFYRHEKDGLGPHFSCYFEKFVHIVTRKTNNYNGDKTREFRSERANRIHWIKPILEHCEDSRINRFRNTEADGSLRDYFWFKERNFMVVIEEVLPDYVLITCFCVDNHNYHYYEMKASNGA